MKILSRFALLSLLALLVGAAGCGSKDDASKGADAKGDAPVAPAGVTKPTGAPAKESGVSNPGGFGK